MKGLCWFWQLETSKHGPLTRYVQLQVAHAPGMPGTFPRHRGLAIPTCITARAWRTCRDASRDRWLAFPLKSVAGKTFPAIPTHVQPANVRIWQEVHGNALHITCHFWEVVSPINDQSCEPLIFGCCLLERAVKQTTEFYLIWDVSTVIRRKCKELWPWWRHQMEHFPRYWPFVRGIHRSPVNSPHKGQWRGALMFSLICA